MTRVRFAPSPTAFLHIGGAKAGLLINGARAALTGQSVGAGAFAIFTALGGDRVIDRLRKV